MKEVYLTTRPTGRETTSTGVKKVYLTSRQTWRETTSTGVKGAEDDGLISNSNVTITVNLNS